MIKLPPPVLASDALREDLAPLEPGRKASRIWCAGLAAGYLTVGIALRLGLGVSGVSPDAASICFAAAAATAATAAVPFTYLWRAVVGALVGLVVVAIGLRGGGPLGLLAAPGRSSLLGEAARLLAATSLPAALLFRSHYRAYRRGKVILGAALLLSLPFLVHEVTVLAEGPGAVARLGAALAIAAVLSSLFAFMEVPATQATGWWAELVAASVVADVGLRQLYAPSPAGTGALGHVLTGLTLVVAASPIGLGLFQVLAAVYAPDARRVDVHQAPAE